MSRYKAVGDWDERARRDYYEVNDTDVHATIVVEQSDLADTRHGFRHAGGAYRVRLKNVDGMRTKTFKGESAHHSAAAYAHDAASKCGDWRWWPDL